MPSSSVSSTNGTIFKINIFFADGDHFDYIIIHVWQAYQLDEGQQWQNLQLTQLTSPRQALVTDGGNAVWTIEHNGTRLCSYKVIN